MRSARTFFAALGLVALVALGVPLTGLAATDDGAAPGECGSREAAVNCGPGNDRRTGGGGDKAPHDDGAGRRWPKISGILWQVLDNTTRQRDHLSGGSGNDWLYPSHGRNTVLGGPGSDYVYAYYGHGLIDCGPGRDTARVRIGTGQYRVRNCEVIRHFCAFGDKPGGGCYKPGENAAARGSG